MHPTLYEGSSLVTLEAMAHRRAVVATTCRRAARQGQARRQRLARRAGRCVGALAAAISGALADPTHWPPSARGPRDRRAGVLVDAAAGDATIALYRDLLS